MSIMEKNTEPIFLSMIIMKTFAISLSSTVFFILALFVSNDGNSQIIISEYLEGASNDKCIELFNTTASDINLSGYSLRRYTNGSSSPTTIALSGTITACGTFVVCNSSSQAALLSLSDQTTGSLSHNGDDAYDLFDGTSVLDVFGDIGCDPGSEWTAAGTNGTQDNGYIRNASICTGVADPTGTCGTTSFTTLATEWTSTQSTSDFSDLGSHTTTCPACSTPANTITTGSVNTPPFDVACATLIAAIGTVDFTSTGTFTGGNIYTAQLSDASGSFASPTNIGTLTSTANTGSINITIPAATAAGTGYLIRVISDNPVTTGSSSAAFTINQNAPCLPSLPATGMIINEWSNGPSGNQEYYEFVVAGECGETVDVREYILDDNNGTFTNPTDYDATASGIAPGHFRFTNAAQWANIPVGSVIVIYNADDPNAALPPDDPTDADNDSLYVVPHTSALFERCTTLPTSTAPDSVYTPCTYSTAPLTGWGALSLRNSGDAIQVRLPNGDYYHGVSYGGSEITGGPDNLKLFSGSGSGDAGWFNDGDPFDFANWSSGTVAGNQTPGSANNAANAAWLLLMRDTTTTNCPITVLPVEVGDFQGKNAPEGNLLYWYTLSERDADYFLIERSTDGKNWKEIGTVKAAGNSTEINNYMLVDVSF
eukprot:CAMPEP_0185587150 /NCGR_PEP_ID=MMETSP0434-20130131/47714_1 /TAXON_ID=626734 ORGANISM="Favella taraikaensis, Strain Fe Narragansett Bay" /NCGR_SAMPLE_ID=MMETSP0434 /ASSEMBLY_ACC=CAM_ASM_000379 /LENGTH=654 /DNA_ID=CAMNT_0028208815 /DNA_START=28 /DNA_END=1989 /DNA_ORIENTATION=+